MLDDTLPHVVPLKGGSNFRDLGGYRTADGRTVRRRAVFRSAHLGTLTDEDRVGARAGSACAPSSTCAASARRPRRRI